MLLKRYADSRKGHSALCVGLQVVSQISSRLVGGVASVRRSTVPELRDRAASGRGGSRPELKRLPGDSLWQKGQSIVHRCCGD
jgi:hypothetical protein